MKVVVTPINVLRQRFVRLGVPGIMKDAKRPGRKKAISEELIKR
jgi:hypothetical protein